MTSTDDGLLDIISANVNDETRGLSVLHQGSCELLDDCNANGIQDHCEADDDCNANGIPDACELADGTANDVDGDGVADACQEDCNENMLPDQWEISTGLITDCNGNSIPDDCDWHNPGDCDGDGLINGCEDDANYDSLPDDCQCYADLNQNDSVEVLDLLEVLSQWGDIAEPHEPPPSADFNRSDIVDIFDFLILLGRWGPCPPPLPTETGACCLPFGSCIIFRELNCEMAMGTYLGDGTTCDGVDCNVFP